MMQKITARRFWFVLLLIAVCVLLCSCSGATSSQDPSQWKSNVENCWMCAVYGSTFELINDIVYRAVEICIPASRFMLGAGLLLVLLFRVGSMMVFPKEDPMQTMKSTAFVFLKAMIVAVLLYDGDKFLNFFSEFFIQPLGAFFLQLSNAILDSVPGSETYFPGIPGIRPPPEMTGIVGLEGNDGAVHELQDSLFGDMGIQVQYVVSRIFSALKSGFPMVLRLFGEGEYFAWLIGLIIAWELFDLILIFPLAFIEAFLVMGFYAVFLPMCLALWPLPGCDQYLKKIFPKEFISAFMDILFGSIVVVLMITLIQLYSDVALDGVLRETTQEANAAIAESYAGGRPSVFVLVSLVMIVKKMALQIGDFTEYFGGRKNSGTIFKLYEQGKKLAKKAVQTLAELAIGVATGGAGAAVTVARKAAVGAARQVTSAAASAAQQGGQGQQGQGQQGQNPGGGGNP